MEKISYLYVRIITGYFESVTDGPPCDFSWDSMMKKLLLWCLLLSAVGCTIASSPKLSDKKFIEIFSDAVELHRRYVHAPDSLIVERKKLLKRHGITQADIEKFLKDRRDHPEKWDALIALIQQRFGEAAEREMKTLQKAKKKDEN